MIVKAYISIGLVGCKKERDLHIDDDELDGLTDAAKEEIIEDYIRDWAMEQIEYGRAAGDGE